MQIGDVVVPTMNLRQLVHQADRPRGPPDHGLPGFSDPRRFIDAVARHLVARLSRLYPSATQRLADGYGNTSDARLEVPDGAYRAVTLRSYDPKTRQWSIWWLDNRTFGGSWDPPMRGGAGDGVGSPRGGEPWHGAQPVSVRLTWSHVTPTSSRCEQAFSTDNGVTWQTSWVADFKRAR